MTPAQVKRFLQMLDTYELVQSSGAQRPHRQAALYHLAIRCGLRKGEINGLRWRDIDFDRREIHVLGQLQDGERTDGKSKHAHRSIPISEDMAQVLRRHGQNQEEERSISAVGWNQDGYVFCSETGTPFNPANIWRQFDMFQRLANLTETCAMCKGSGTKGSGAKAGPCGACDGHGVISSFRFHDMRHTYAALNLAARVEIFILSRRMGHSSISVTSDLYGHLYPGNTHGVEAVDSLVKEG
jgi:integrase